MTRRDEMKAVERARLERLLKEFNADKRLWLTAFLFKAAFPLVLRLELKVREKLKRDDEISPFIYTMW